MLKHIFDTKMTTTQKQEFVKIVILQQVDKARRIFKLGSLKTLSFLLILFGLFYSQIGFAQTTVELNTADIAVCPGATVNFTVTFTGGIAPFSVDYTYDGVTQSYSGMAPTANLSVIATNTGNITLSNPLDNNGNPLDDALHANSQMLVTVNPLPTATYLVGDPTICNGSTTSISINGSQAGKRYDLYSPTSVLMGTQNGNGIGINISATPTVSGIYRVVATDITTTCSVELTDKANISVESLPNAALAVSDASACSGNNANIVLTAAEANTSYQLRDASNNPIGLPQIGAGNLTFTLTPAVAGNYNIYATRTTGLSCQAVLTDISTVTINPLPTAFNVTGGGGYCSGGAGVAIGLSSSQVGVNYQLKLLAVNIGLPVAGTGAVISFGNKTIAGNYTVLATNTTTSCTNTMTGNATVTINPLPTVAPTADVYTLCSGISTQLHANPTTLVGIAAYAWSNGATVGEPTVTPLNTTPYTVTVVDNNGCSNTLLPSITITVNPNPIVTISPVGAGGFTICSGSPITLRGTSNILPLTSWAWNTTGLVGAVDPILDYTFSPGTSTIVSLDVIDNKGCAGHATKAITVNVKPNANPGPDRSMCDGVGTTLDASGSDAGGPLPATITGYNWVGVGTNVTQTVFPNATTTYTLIVTNSFNCTDASDVTISHLSNPNVAVTSDAPLNAICHGDDIVLTATPTGGSGIYTSYIWTPFAPAISSITVFPANAIKDDPDLIHPYSVNVTDNAGCIGTGTINVTVSSLPLLSISNDGDSYCQFSPTIVTLVPNRINATSIWSSPTLNLTNGPSFNQFSTDPAVNTDNNYPITYTFTNTKGCTNSVNGAITILPYSPPNILSINTPSGPNYCHTDAGPYLIQGIMVPDLQGAIGIVETLTFSGPAAAFTDNGDGTGTLIPSLAGQGTFTFTYSVTTGGFCDRSATQTINIGAPVTFTFPTDMCVGESNQPLTATPVGGTWKIDFADPIGNPISSVSGVPYAAGELIANQPGTYTITYTYTAAIGAGCTNSTVGTCVVHALPDLSFKIDTFTNNNLAINFCSNDIPVLLVGYDGGVLAGGGTFTDDGSGAVTLGFFDPAAANANNKIYYQFTDANGCTNIDSSKNVKVNIAPIVDITGLNSNYCKDIALFTVTGDPQLGIGGKYGRFDFPIGWTLGTQYDSINGTATLYPANIAANNYSLNYTVVNANGCSGTTTEFFNINALPTVDFNGIPASGKICKNATPITITGSPTGAAGFFDSMVGLTDHGDGTATFNPSTLALGNHSITYNYTNPATGCTNKRSKNIKVLSIPTQFSVAALGSNGEYYCQYDVAGVPLSVTGSQIGYRYDLIRNGATIVSTVPIAAGGPFTFAGDFKNGIYSVMATDTSGCSILMNDPVTVVERPAVADAGTITGNVTVCADGATIYTYTVPLIANATSYIWNIPPDAALISTIPPGNSITVKFNTTYTTGAISVYGTTGFVPVCSDGLPNSITVTKSSIPVALVGASINSSALLDGVSYIVCEGEVGVTFSVDPLLFSNETEFEWTTTSGKIMTDTTASSITINFAAGNPLSVSGVVSVRARNACSPMAGYVTHTITVNPVPNVSASILGGTITCNPASLTQLNASTIDPVVPTWLWTASGGGIIVPGDETSKTPNVSREGTFTVQIKEIINNKACYNTASIVVGANKVAPTVTIDVPGVLYCSNAIAGVNLQVNSSAAVSTYQWAYTAPAHLIGGLPCISSNPFADEPGLYTVTVTDVSNSCTKTAQTTVTRNTTPPTITVTNPESEVLSCALTTATLLGTSPSGGTLMWTGPGAIGGSTTSTPTVTVPGIYTLTVTDLVNGCTNALPVSVTQNITPPAVTLTNLEGNITCGNTSVILEADVAAVSNATFVWSASGGGIIITTSGTYSEFAEAGAAGIYTVVATNPANGCASVATSIPVVEDISAATSTTITSGTVGFPNLTCTNLKTINLVANIVGDGGIGTYLWTGPGVVAPTNLNIVNVTAGGTYTLTYRHSITGCPTTRNVVIVDMTASPLVSIINEPYQITCSNLTTSRAITPSLTATGDVPSTTYAWTGPVGAVYSASTSLITTVNLVGTYTITATNIYGCKTTDNTTVSLNTTAPSITVTNPETEVLTCAATSVTLSGSSTAGTTLLWTGPGAVTNPTTSTPTVSVPGTYTLTVTEPTNGCTSALPVLVTQNITAPVAIISNPEGNITCANTSVILEADVAAVSNATFAWSASGGGHIVTTSGTYSEFAEVDAAGAYSVIATNPTNGCASVASSIPVVEDHTVATTTAITSGTIGYPNLTCTNLGSINLAANIIGDIGTGTYSWTGTGVMVPPLNANNVNVTTAGSYTLTYRHSVTGCPTSVNVSIYDKTTLPAVAIDAGPFEITCADLTAKKAIKPTLSATGDVTSAYLWTGPATATYSNNTALSTTVDKPGTYTLTVTNPFGCVNSANVTVTSSLTAPNISVTTPAPSLLTCLVSAVPVSGASTTLGATYLWTTAVAGATISTPNNFTSNVDKAGLYTLTVTNPINGCTASLPVTVNENKTVPTITALVITDANPNITCTNTSVQLNATVGSVVDATFIWSPGTGVNSGAYNQFNEVSAAGIYTATSTHPISGCTDSKTINVTTDYSAPVINIIADATTITCTKSTIILNGSSSVNATNFVWTYSAGGNITNGGTTNTATISTGATYTLTAEHNVTGCTASSSEIIAENKTAPSVTVTGEPYTITCGNPTRILSAVATAGTSILWTGPGITANGTTLSPTINQSGNYRITATSANGCSSFDDVVVGLDTNIPAVSVLQNPSDITCTTTSVSIAGSSPVAGVAYLWTRLSGSATITNPTLSTASVNAKGDFRLTVTAPNGCTNFGDVTVNDNLTAPNLSLPAVDDNELTCSQTTVALNGSSVTPGVLYSWSTLIVGATIQNGSSPTPTVDKTGNYTVVVTNPVNGCTTSGTTTVNGTFTTPTIVIAAPSGQITCSTATITLDATATTNASSYLWVASNGGHIQSNATTTQPLVDAAGRYTLTANHTLTGCPATAFVDVTADVNVPNIDIFDPFPAKLTCNVLSVQLLADASALATKTILWTTSDGNITSADNITNPTVDKPGTYAVKITNTTGCYAIRGVTVNQNITKPTIQIDAPLPLTCSRLQVSITSTANSVDGSSMNYTWVPGAGGNIVSGVNTLNPVVNAVADYTLNVTDNGNGCANSSLVSVVADIAPPNVSVNTSPAKITCITSSVQLNGSSSTPNVSYLWTGPGGIINPTTTTPLVSAVGTYNLVVTNLSNNCTITSPNVVVTSDLTVPIVTVNAPSGSLTCTVSAVTLSASNNTNYNYTWTGPGNISTPNSYTTTVDAVGTYSLAVVDKLSGCNVTNTVAVIQDITPAASPIISNIQTCFGTASTGFTVTSGSGVKWYGNAALTLYLGTGNTYVPTQTSAGVHSYYATATGLNGCEGLPSEVTFTIHALPNAPITSGNSICQGSAGKPISAVGNNIKWYDATNVFITASSSYTPTVIAAGSYTYYATQTDINGCESQSRSVIYVINTVPLAPSFLNTSLNVCEGSSNPSFTVIGSNIKWYKNLAGAVLSTQNTYQPLDIVPATYTYYATQTANQCESANTTGTITISALPIKYNVTGGGNYCESLSGLAVGLNNSQTGVTYELWLNGTTLVTDLPGTTGNPVNFGNQLTAGTYTIIAKNLSGCSTTMNGSVAIVVNPLPRTPSAVSGPATVCQGETVVFSVDPITNATSYQWTIPAGMQFVSGTSQNTITVYVSNLAATGSISVVGVNSCGNGPTSGSKLIQVNSLPLAPGGSITGITTLCEGQNGTYEIANITGATSYEWTLLPGMTVVGGANTSKLDVHFNLNESGGNIWVQGKNGCGLGPKSADLTILVKKIPVPLAIPDINVCAANTTVANGSLKPGETGLWSVLYGSPALVQSPTNPTSSVTNLRMGQNTLVWTLSNNGCPAYDTVNIFNNIVAMNAGDDQVICSNSTVFKATSVTDAFWSVASGWGSGIIADKLSPISQITQIQQDTNKFVWQVIKSGCTSTDTVTIYNFRPLQPYAGIDQTVDVDHTALDATPPETGTTGFWSILNGSGTFVNAADPKTQVSGLISGTNTLVWTVVRRSCSLTDEMKIENIMLATPEAGVTQSICTNYTTLDAIFPPIGTGEWSVISGQATFTNPTSNSTKVTGLGYGNNWLKWTVRTSGIGMKYDSVLIVNNTPSVANAGPDLVLCVDTTLLMAGTPIYGTGNWTLINGSGNVINLNNPSSVFRSIGQGKNDLKWTINNNGCTSEDLVSITNNTPTTAYAGLDQTICFDTTILYPNTPSIGVGTWSLISGSGAFTGNVVKNLAPDNNILRYTITKGSCKSTDDVIVTNNNPTTPAAGYDQNLCMSTASATLNANQALQGSGVWSIISGSGTFTSLFINNPVVTNLANGINIYRWTITKNGCTEQDEVIVSSNYIAATAGEDVTLCVDNTQLLASNPVPGIGTWSVVGNSAAIFDSQNSPNSMVRNLTKGDNTIRWTVNNNGCVTSDDVLITNNQPSQALAGENQAVCSQTANLNGNNVTFFDTRVWSAISGSATFADPTSSQTVVTNLSGGPNVLRWTVTKGTCISYDEVTITSNLPVSVFAGNDQVACSNTAVLAANPPSLGSGQWSIITGAGSFSDRTSYSTTVNNLAQGNNIFKWTVSSADCHVSDTVIIRSSIPTRSIAGSNQIVCSSTTTLAGNTPTNGTGTWVVTSGSVNFTNRTSPTSTATDIALGTNILAWIIDKDGCQSSSEITITNNSPSAPLAGNDVNICGDSTRLFADPPSIGTGKWSLVSGDAAILNTNNNETRVVNIKFGANTFRWTVTNKNCIISDDVVITSNYSIVNAGADFEVNSPSTQLIGNKPPLGTGLWTLSAGNGVIENPSSFDTRVNSLGAGSNVFEWSITYNGCTAKDAVVVNYIVWPIADFEPSSYTGCSPLEVNFVNTSIGGSPYSWNFGDGSTSNQPNIIHTFENPGTYTVRLTTTAPLGNVVLKEKKIVVHGHPTAKFDVAPKIVYIPGQYISCFNYSVYADSSYWDFGDGRDLITKLAPRYNYTDTGKFNITLKVVNSYGCKDSMTIAQAVQVKKRSGFFFPEAFTPNPTGSSGGVYNSQDRSNDVFYPIIVDGSISEFEFRVYNRSGVLIFISTDFNIGWDGYYKGKLQPQDVYIYKFSGRYNSGDPFQKVGNVLLIKKEK